MLIEQFTVYSEVLLCCLGHSHRVLSSHLVKDLFIRGELPARMRRWRIQALSEPR